MSTDRRSLRVEIYSLRSEAIYNIGTLSRAWTPPVISSFSSTAKKTTESCSVYENVLMMGKTNEEKPGRLVEHLNPEAFKYYFDNFMEENAPTNAANPFEVVKKALLEKFSTKNTESETMEEAMNLSYQGEDVKEFFVKTSNLYKEANLNEGTKHGIIMEAIKSDQNLLHFVLLRKVRTFEGDIPGVL